MYLDFENLDLDTLSAEYGRNSYFSSVISFIETILKNESFQSYTSGSTGDPKLLCVEKVRAIESAVLSNEYFKIDASTRFLLCLDIKYIGSKMLLLRAYIAKAKVEVVVPSLDFYLHSTISVIDFISLTPLHIHRLLASNQCFFDKVKTCLIGASGVSIQLENEIKARNFSTRFYESFAMTETLSHFALRDISAQQSCFKLLPGFEISITENQCMQVYHKTILPQKIVTNDIIEIFEDYTFSFKGRLDNVINSGGIKLCPEEIEKSWSAFLPFKFIISSEPSPIYGQQIILITNTIVTRSEINLLLKMNEIPIRLWPKEFYFSKEWVETQSHKPLRKEIIKNKTMLD